MAITSTRLSRSGPPSDYVVVYVNPRGSTSYGEQFANLIHHAYPGDDFADLNSGVDAVIAKGYIDPNNLFVTGGSGGGVLTCWTIAHTTRFRAAASLYPVINWYSWTLTSDLPAFSTLYWFPGMPWDNVEQYMKRSPISYVNNVKTPTMLMTGEEDWRTPISEAEQYYSAAEVAESRECARARPHRAAWSATPPEPPDRQNRLRAGLVREAPHFAWSANKSDSVTSAPCDTLSDVSR